jgi:hypothetical protein
MRRAVLGVLLIALLAAAPAAAYEHLSQHAAVSGVQSSHWASLPINLTLDGGPTDLSAEIATAVGTWNAVPTAKDPFGTVIKSAVDFDETNLGSAWGNLTGDGSQEVVVDETGRALTALGFAPAAVNGFGPRHEFVGGGQALIDDMFLIINGNKHDFDRPSTELHELGHTIGLAHTTAGFAAEKDGALSPPLISQVPTMHPFATPGTDRRSLEADDRAAISDLYPDASFSSTDGTIKGRVTRCDGGLPVLGVNVRAVNVNDPSIQISRVTGFDGGPEGSYVINGVPPGDYFVIAEPLSGDDELVDRLAMNTAVDTDFTQEYFNASKEGDCAQDTDPAAREPVGVTAGLPQTADIKVSSASLALVIDVTRSMGPELGAIKVGLETMITALSAVPGDFPQTAIVTFDDHANVAKVSRDPDTLRSVIAGLTTHGTPDCPEGSNAALMTAGRLLGTGGRAVLVTDADALRSGPSRADVDALYQSKGAQIDTLLSGSCPPEQNPPAAPRLAAAAPAPAVIGAEPDIARPLDVLGVENSLRTFSEESLFSGGLFSFQPEIKAGGQAAAERYSNTLANLGVSAVRPAVAAITPSALPEGATLDVELAGSNTNFLDSSAVAVAGGGVSVVSQRVLSATRMVVRLAVDAGAATGFRDVTVTTDLGAGSVESARGIGATEVTGPAAGPTVVSVVPSTVEAGETRDVAVSGALTHFAAGLSNASFGDDVTVHSVTVTSPTTAVANVTVAPGAAIGFRDVSVQTGSEDAGESVTGPFLVAPETPSVPRLTGASVHAAPRGSTFDITVTGAGTSFAAGRSALSVSGSGVGVIETTVDSPTALVARVRIAEDAPLGFRDLRVTTGARALTLRDALEVTPAAAVAAVTPSPGGSSPPPPPAPEGGCRDRAAPRATLAKPVVKARKLTLRGRATDAGCAGLQAVEVSVSLAAGRRCRFIGSNGKLGKARRCTKPVFLRAKGASSWKLRLRRALPPGRYTVRVRARDRVGNVQAAAATRKVTLARRRAR